MKKALLVCIFTSSLTTIIQADDQKVGTAPTSSAVTTQANVVKPAVEAIKIRYVDPYKIIPKLEQWNDERIKIQKELENRTKQIEDLKVAYTTKANELQSRASLTTDAAKDNAIKELKRLETNIQIEQQSFQEYAERTSQEAQVAIFREIEAAAKEYAQANGIDFVFAGGAIFVNEKYDISDMIANIMNKKYGAQKKTAAAKTAAETKK